MFLMASWLAKDVENYHNLNCEKTIPIYIMSKLLSGVNIFFGFFPIVINILAFGKFWCFWFIGAPILFTEYMSFFQQKVKCNRCVYDVKFDLCFFSYFWAYQNL